MGLYRLIIMLYFFLILSFAALCGFALETQNEAEMTSNGKYLKIHHMLLQNAPGGRKWLVSRKMVGIKTKIEREKMKIGDQVIDGTPKISGANHCNGMTDHCCNLSTKSPVPRKVKLVGFASFSADYRGRAVEEAMNNFRSSESSEDSPIDHKKKSVSSFPILRTLSSITSKLDTSSHQGPLLKYQEFTTPKHKKWVSPGRSRSDPFHSKSPMSKSGDEEEDGLMLNMDYNHCPHHKPPINNAQPRSFRLCRP